MKPSKGDLTQRVLQACQARGPAKTICPSEVARDCFGESWRDHMRNVRDAACVLVDHGQITATRRGEIIYPTQPGGPIRLQQRMESRPADGLCRSLLNIGPVCSEDLRQVGIHTLADLRSTGATTSFQSVMVDKLHRGDKHNLFHAMYYYALWGAIHDIHCTSLSPGLRTSLQKIVANIKTDLLGPPLQTNV